MPIPPDLEALNKRCERSISKMTVDEAFAHIGLLVDDSSRASFERGVKRALFLLDDLEKRALSDKQGALAAYFRANAWTTRSEIANVRQSSAWEAPERQEEMLAHSRAANHLGFAKLDKIRRCQILTNHANLLNAVGRPIDAIAGWDAALNILPNFAMALGNRGVGLKHYARMILDNRERAILLLHGYDGLQGALAPEAIWDLIDPSDAIRQFSDLANRFAAALKIDSARAMQKLDQGDEGSTRIDRAYRRWCLEHRLFLCPLNDLGPFAAAALDDLILPPITEGLDDRPDGYVPPPIICVLNQMKQEYASTRFMLFEGMSSTRIHFSDRGVALTDTLDYPLYSLASERIRTAYRVAYSLLDKIAFLIDRHWKLGKIPQHISFKNVWMVEKKQRLLPQFESSNNWPLRGLYWLSKELFDEQLNQTTAADARELHSIRNALEHTYLRVSEGWAKPFTIGGPSSNDFGIGIGSEELEAKAIRVMQMARSALFYVSFAIGHEEREKKRANPEHLIGSMPLFGLQEKRKRRDPS